MLHENASKEDLLTQVCRSVCYRMSSLSIKSKANMTFEQNHESFGNFITVDFVALPQDQSDEQTIFIQGPRT